MKGTLHPAKYRWVFASFQVSREKNYLDWCCRSCPLKPSLCRVLKISLNCGIPIFLLRTWMCLLMNKLEVILSLLWDECAQYYPIFSCDIWSCFPQASCLQIFWICRQFTFFKNTCLTSMIGRRQERVCATLYIEDKWQESKFFFLNHMLLRALPKVMCFFEMAVISFRYH